MVAGLHRHAGLRLHAQRADPHGPLARHRHADRRRDRRAREHRAPPAAGQGPLRRGPRRHGRDRPRGHGHHLHDHRRLRPRGLHGRHGRPVLLRVRHHGRRGGGWCRSSSASPSTRCSPRAGWTPTSSGATTRTSSAGPCSASTSGSTTCTCATSALLGWSLRHRAAGARSSRSWPSSASFPILAILGGDFMPDFNRGEYQVSFKATPGATLRETGERALEMVRRLKTLPDVDYTYTTIGEAGTPYRPVTEGVIYVKLKPTHGQDLLSQVLDEAAAAVIRDVPGPHLRPHRGRAVRPEAASSSACAGPRSTSSTASRASCMRPWGRSRASPTSRPASRRASPSCASSSTATAPATSASTSRRWR